MKNIAQTFVTEIGRTPVYIFVMDCLAMSMYLHEQLGSDWKPFEKNSSFIKILQK